MFDLLLLLCIGFIRFIYGFQAIVLQRLIILCLQVLRHIRRCTLRQVSYDLTNAQVHRELFRKFHRLIVFLRIRPCQRLLKFYPKHSRISMIVDHFTVQILKTWNFLGIITEFPIIFQADNWLLGQIQKRLWELIFCLYQHTQIQCLFIAIHFRQSHRHAIHRFRINGIVLLVRLRRFL